MRRWMLILAILLAAAPLARAANYYIDPASGSNSNPGTEAQPWATLAYAEQNAANGSTIYLRAGDYGDISLTDATNGRTSMSDALTITRYSGEIPTIDRVTINAATALYLIFDGLDIVAPAEDGDGATITFLIANGSYITLHDCLLQGYLGWDAENSRYDDALSTTNAIKIGAYGNVGVGNITLDGCEITGCGTNAVQCSGTKNGPLIIKNCEVHSNGASQIALEGTAGQLITVQDCSLHTMVHVWHGPTGNWNHGSGFSIRTCPLLIQRNTVRHCGDSAPLTMYNGVFPTTGFQNVTIKNNLFYDSTGVGGTITMRDIGNNCSFTHNTVIGYHYGATKAYYYQWALYALYCTSYDPTTIVFANNIFLGYVGSPPAGVHFVGNHVWAFISGTNWYDQTELDAAFPGNTLYSENNLTQPDLFEAGTNTWGWLGGGTWPTYTYVQSHGQDISTGYKLTASCPAVNDGVAEYGASDDLTGELRADGEPDAGCYEYGTDLAHPPSPAVNLAPVNDATNQDENVNLTWVAGDCSPTHHVFFGTNESAVTAGTGGTDKGTQDALVYDPGLLAWDTTYYWRIREENADGNDAGTTIHFTVRSEPLPLHGVIMGVQP